MRALSLIFAAVLLSAAAPVFAQNQITDDQIHDRVMQRLAADRDVKGGGIDVEVANGVVTLRGKVHEAKQKEKAERITKKVKGVRQVVNELKLELGSTVPPGE
jgi:hyperosmotically inducible periplasmic protein